MDWKTKSKIQNAIAALPSKLADECYFAMQRHAGGMKSPCIDLSISRFQRAQAIWRHILSKTDDAIGSTVFDLGSGWSAHVPLSYFLMGADTIISYDLYRHMRPEVNKDVVHFLVNEEKQVRDIFGDLLITDRYEELLTRIRQKSFHIDNLLSLCRTRYVAPADASSVSMESDTVDFYTSNLVLQHIPQAVLEKIFCEANRITKADGVFVHRINYSDHFSHSDANITAGHFLKFNDEEWDKLAGNRFMFQNRMRPSQYIQMLEEIGHVVEVHDQVTDQSTLEQLDDGRLIPDFKFGQFSANDLAASSSTLVSRQARQ